MTALIPEALTLNQFETLVVEAEYLHCHIFSRPPTCKLVDAYILAHAGIEGLLSADELQLRTVELIVSRRLDALGIEPWLRSTRKRHALSAKLLLLAYLAECDARHPEFARHVAVGQMALAHMGLATLKAIFRLFHGYVQKAWHGLV